MIYGLINASNCFLIAAPPDLLLPPRNWCPPQGHRTRPCSRGHTERHGRTHRRAHSKVPLWSLNVRLRASRGQTSSRPSVPGVDKEHEKKHSGQFSHNNLGDYRSKQFQRTEDKTERRRPQRRRMNVMCAAACLIPISEPVSPTWATGSEPLVMHFDLCFFPFFKVVAINISILTIDQISVYNGKEIHHLAL